MDDLHTPAWRWSIAGIVICGALFRIAAVLGNGRFWFDEIITWEIAARPFADMWHYLAVENHPPLHYYIIHGWMRLFGDGAITVKLSSVFAGTLSIWATGAFGRRLFGMRGGLWAAGLTALSTYQIFFSAEARMYPWLYFFGIISLWMWWEMMEKTEKKYRVYWWLSTVAALYTHLGGVFLLIVEGGWFLWVQWREMRRSTPSTKMLNLRTVCMLMTSSVIAWLPWIIVFLREKAQTFNRNAWYFWVDLVEPLPIEATRRFFFFDSYAEFMDFFAWVFVIVAFALALGMVRANREGHYAWRWEITRTHGYCLTILFVPLFIGFLTHVSVIKIYTIASAGAYLLAGAGLAKLRLPKPMPSLLVPAAVTGLFFAHMVGVIVEVKPAWRDVGQYLTAQQHEADAIVILSHAYQTALEHYYHGVTPVLPFYPLADDTGGDTLLRAVRRNWYTILSDDNIDTLESMTAGKQKIFLVIVGRFYKVERIGLEWFMAHGWKLKRIEQWEDFMVNPEVYLFERMENY